MSKKNAAPTAEQIAALDATAETARQAHEDAQAEYDRAVAQHQHAADTLADVEERAATGLEVNAEDHARLESTVRLLGQRPARLLPAVESTRETMHATAMDARRARAAVLVAGIPDPDEAKEKALAAVVAWHQAVFEYGEAVDAVSDEARELLGEPATDRFGRRLTGFYVGGRRFHKPNYRYEFDKMKAPIEAAIKGYVGSLQLHLRDR